MRRVELKPRAEADIENVYRYLFREGSQELSDRFVDHVFDSFDDINDMPTMGTILKSKRLSNFRRWRVKGFEKYLIFYIYDDEVTHIVRVLHGARDIAAILDEEEDAGLV